MINPNELNEQMMGTYQVDLQINIIPVPELHTEKIFFDTTPSIEEVKERLCHMNKRYEKYILAIQINSCILTLKSK